MKITINILKRHLYVTAILIAVFLGALFAIAYNSAGTGGNPPSMGHSIDEIDWSKKIPVAVVIDNTLTAKDLQVNGRIRAVGYDISDNAGVSTLVGGKLGTIQNGYGSGESCMEIDFSKTTCFQRGSYCTFVVITDYNGNDDVRVLRSQVAASHDDKPDTANIVHVRHTSGGEAHLRWTSSQQFELGWSRAFVRNFRCADDELLPWGKLSFKVADNIKATIYWEGPGKI